MASHVDVLLAAVGDGDADAAYSLYLGLSRCATGRVVPSGYCEGLVPDLLSRRHDLLKQAADLGSLHAQIDFVHVVPPWQPRAAQQGVDERLLAQIAGWRVNAIAYLVQAQQRGSGEAMYALATAYRGDAIDARNPTLALANFIAAQAIYSSQGRDTALMETRILELSDALRDPEIQQARRIAAQLLASEACCVLRSD